LRFQSALCLSPVLARGCLEASGGDPVAALARSGKSAAADSERIESWISDLARRGIRALPFTASAYPPSRRALTDPPPLLLVRGAIADLQRPAIAIVGARAATGYGRGVAEELGSALAAAGFVVVSGLARGVDAAAHRGALAAKGRTVAVLGCGPDRVYPPEHRQLADRVAQAGAVVSELSPGRPPAAPHFPLRNRLISGLVQAVVVVEARLRSGSLITARHALNQGREVLVVPGPIDSPHAAGSNALLRDGARPVLEPLDVLEAVASPFVRAPLAAADPPPGPSDGDQATLYSRLLGQSAGHDALAREFDWPAGRLALALMGLEIEGWLESDRDGCLRAVPASLRAVRGRA
jgi:DNA processing protein